MELTLDQALKQAFAAHTEGKLQDAERLYRAILQTQPNHPDANHNLGALAVGVGKPIESLPFFKQALDSNPQIEQFWLSYIDALVKSERFEEVERLLVEGEKSGVSTEKLEPFRQQIQTAPTKDKNSIRKDLPVSAKRKAPSEQKKSKRTAARGELSGASPSEDQINLLAEHYDASKWADAEALATRLIQLFPTHSFAWKVLGAVFKKTARVGKSLAPMQTAVKLSPQDAEAHSNLGVTLQELGRLDEAEASYRQAISLNPNYAAAHNNIGILLNSVGRPDAAVASHLQAITLQPDYPAAYENFSDAIKNVRFSAESREFYPIVIQILTKGNFTRPIDLAPSILSLLRQDPLIKNLPLETSSSMNVAELSGIIESLHKVPLLHHLMRVCPLPDLQFERFFSNIRRSFLANLENLKPSPNLSYFLSTLSLHCFVNEYVYVENDDEVALVEKLEDKVMQAITHSEQPESIEILCLSSYRPLHQYAWSQKLRALDSMKDVKQRLLEDPLAEHNLAKNISALEEISNEVSNAVRKQYEENPYPRWVKTKIPAQSKSISRICADMNLCIQSESIAKITAPAILIAGCGTGQQSLHTATLFSNCHVTAVDLSLASLAYAKRKTIELKLTNLEYMLADILHLDKIGREFDIVESTGVLHHMHAPMVGWSVLTNLLKPGGLMKIGLYSELARPHIAGIREKTKWLRTAASKADIRAFRNSLAESDDKNHKLLTTSNDFFSYSNFRDLLFNVQEHHFTLPQIKKSLDQLGLKFCGFESEQIVHQFKNYYGNAADTSDLTLWHEFEQCYPRTFAGMYQFWCQKIL